jgi:hypothetical protein
LGIRRTFLFLQTFKTICWYIEHSFEGHNKHDILTIIDRLIDYLKNKKKEIRRDKC